MEILSESKEDILQALQVGRKCKHDCYMCNVWYGAAKSGWFKIILLHCATVLPQIEARSN